MKRIILVFLILAATLLVKAQTPDNGPKTVVASGADTYTITSSAPTIYTLGESFKVKFTNANTGPATLNRSGKGPKSIKKNGSTVLASGDISDGQVHLLVYDGSSYQCTTCGGGTGASGVTSVTGDGVDNTTPTTPVINLTADRTVTTSGAILQTDHMHIVYFNSASAINFTIDQLTIRSQVTLININTGTVTFVNGSGVTYSGVSSITQNQSASVLYKSTSSPIILSGAASQWSLTGNSLLSDGILGTLSNSKLKIYTNNLQIGDFDTGTASSSIGKFFNLNGQLTAAANNDVLTAAKFNPSWSVGAFTGVIKGFSQWGTGVTNTILAHQLPGGETSHRYYGSSGNYTDVYQTTTDMMMTPSASTRIIYKPGSSSYFGIQNSSGSVVNAFDPNWQLGADVNMGGAPLIFNSSASAATSTGTQSAMGSIYFRGTYWNGATEQKRGMYINSGASATNNQVGTLVFGQNINDAATNVPILTMNSNSSATWNLLNSQTFTFQNNGSSLLRIVANGNLIQLGAGTNSYFAPMTTGSSVSLTAPIGMKFSADGYTNATASSQNINWFFNAGQTRTTGGGGATGAIMRIGHSSTGSDPTSGSAPFYTLHLTPIINQTGTASGKNIGIYYAPTETAILAQHVAFQNDAGFNVVNSTISPTQISANTNDWSPTGILGCATIRMSSDAARDLTGITQGTAGRVLYIVNVGAFNITLKDDVTSTAANRFQFNADIILAPEQEIMLKYDGVSSRWRSVSR